jgi:membrane-associated phospholipid phosphatase
MKLDSPAVLTAAQWLASHALPAFWVALALLLVAVAAGWKLGLRYGVHRAGKRFSPLSYLVGHLLLGFALITGAAVLFAELAENLGDGRKLGQLDLVFSNAIGATVGTPTLKAFAALTHLGDALTLTVLCLGVAAWLLRRRQFVLGIAWVTALAGNAVLNSLLKNIFARARPLHGHGLASANGFSFPSGHSSGAVVAYGMLAYVAVRLLPERHAAWRLPVVLIAAATAFTVCSSRVFLQVHFASDVLAGIASGSAWLAVCMGAVEVARYRAGARSR